MNNFLSKRMLTLAVGTLFVCTSVMAGDGTKENPYTVSELNAQKDALSASGNAVWVKADLKGLGEDGTSQSNADTDVKNMAGLFGDATGTFVAYSWQILGQLELADLTNTKDLLISLTYGTSGHPYGNQQNPQYASNYEPTDAHFSLVEVHNALQVSIENGLRGFHFPACLVIPQNVIAVKVSAGYKAGASAYVNYTNYIGANAEYVLPKNAAVVLMADGGTYDFVLGTAFYDQTISNGNAMEGGTKAGENAGTTNNRARFRFVCDGYRSGFERNSNENCTVILNSKDEVFLQVSSQEDKFWGNYSWETPEKNWISWGGGKYSDFVSSITSVPVQNKHADAIYNLQGQRLQQKQQGLNIVNGKKVMAK